MRFLNVSIKQKSQELMSRVEKQGGKISADVSGDWTHFDIILPLRNSAVKDEESE